MYMYVCVYIYIYIYIYIYSCICRTRKRALKPDLLCYLGPFCISSGRLTGQEDTEAGCSNGCVAFPKRALDFRF